MSGEAHAINSTQIHSETSPEDQRTADNSTDIGSWKGSESIGQLEEWGELNLLSRDLLCHNDPSDDYSLPLRETFVLGYDIKPERQLVQIIVSSAHFGLNSLRALETGWVIQLNGDAKFAFFRAKLNMIELVFNSLGEVNNPAC